MRQMVKPYLNSIKPSMRATDIKSDLASSNSELKKRRPNFADGLNSIKMSTSLYPFLRTGSAR